MSEAPDYDDVQVKSADQELMKVLVIQTSRVYDVMLALLGVTDPHLASYIQDLHKNGQFFGPDPAILEDSFATDE